MGCRTCSRRDAARPSQKNSFFQARFSNGMELRVPIAPLMPRLKRRFWAKPVRGRWQLAQDSVLFAESRRSKNNWLPNETPSTVNGLSRGRSGWGKDFEKVKWYGVALGAIRRGPDGAVGSLFCEVRDR